MSVVVVGLHEGAAPLELLERLSVSESDLPKALSSLCDSPHLAEAVVVSTCMRTEVYAVLERFHDGLADIQRFFETRLGESPGASDELEKHLVVAYDDEAVRHLFAVAAGIDSPVLGEGEILRQVRTAEDHARRERAAGPVLTSLFRHAVGVGKRARTETAIARGTTSLAHVAVALARARSGGSLSAKRVVVLGAGEMGEGIIGALANAGAELEVVVVNRNWASASALAAAAGGRAVPLATLAAEIAEADVLLTATAAPDVLVGAAELRALLENRPSRPLLVVDAAVPRDVDPTVAELDGVTLLDLDDMRAFAAEEMAGRSAEVANVEAIIDEELERYRVEARGRSVAPVVASLRAKAEAVRAAELARVAARLDADQLEAVDALSKRIVAKLLHEPTVQVKEAAGSARGERLAEALRTLFDL